MGASYGRSVADAQRDVRPRGRRRHPKFLIGTAFAIGALVLAGCVPAAPPSTPPPAPTVTLQTVDEVRPFDTTELGVPHPTGVAYDAASNRFAIAAVSDGSTKV